MIVCLEIILEAQFNHRKDNMRLEGLLCVVMEFTFICEITSHTFKCEMAKLIVGTSAEKFNFHTLTQRTTNMQ